MGTLLGIGEAVLQSRGSRNWEVTGRQAGLQGRSLRRSHMPSRDPPGPGPCPRIPTSQPRGRLGGGAAQGTDVLRGPCVPGHGLATAGQQPSGIRVQPSSLRFCPSQRHREESRWPKKACPGRSLKEWPVQDRGGQGNPENLKDFQREGTSSPPSKRLPLAKKRKSLKRKNP